MSARLTFRVDSGAMRQVRGFVSEFVAQHGIAAVEQSRILIVLEELVTNLDKYGYQNRTKGNAEVALQLDDARLTIEFADDGDPFDPLTVPLPNLEAPIEERDVGGLGIQILRALADEARYHRVDERNVLQLTRQISFIKS
jgi:anti-sigma regulatory factor (Ser/Thr protein kinase)